MSPPRTRFDPDGFYDRLGVQPDATHAAIVTAFRGKARVVHPDVPDTGNATAFVAVKQAYDVLSNQQRRADYDRKARVAALDAIEPAVIDANDRARRRTHPGGAAAFRTHSTPATPGRADPAGATAGRTYPSGSAARRIYQTAAPGWMAAILTRPPRFADIRVLIGVGFGAFLCLCVYQAVTHLRAPPKIVRNEIRPNAATVAPLSSSAHQAVLYGPAPVRLPGTPNFYVVPATTPAVLWRLDQERNALVPVGQLPPFSSVQAVRVIRQNGMLEVVWNDKGNGFVSADHLTPGNPTAARQAYCGYNAGPTPFDGEALERRGSGNGTLAVENRAVQPAVVKLRDGTGAVALSVFLGPGGHAEFNGLPAGTYQTEFAIGELWSRSCNSFAAGMRARRMDQDLILPGEAAVVVTTDAGEPPSVDIPDHDFERN